MVSGVAQQLRPAIVLMVVMTVLTGLIYPLVITGVGQVAFPFQANGSLLTRSDGAVAGSTLIGQNFTSPKYFHPRPSVTMSADPTPAPAPYNAANSVASNAGPTNKDFIKTVGDRADAYRKENNLATDAQVPVDAVTASGSGLDPDISPANAALQVTRVAQARNIHIADVQVLVAQNTEGRTFGLLGEPRVKVLLLNQALDARK